MRPIITRLRETGLAVLIMILVVIGVAYAQDSGTVATSYSPVDIKEDFASTMARMKDAKPEIMKRQMDLLHERYDLSNLPAKGVTMSRGKAMSAASQVKRRRPELDIVVFERGPHTSFSACGIPYYVGRVVDEEEKLIIRTPEKFQERDGIDARVLST